MTVHPTTLSLALYLKHFSLKDIWKLCFSEHQLPAFLTWPLQQTLHFPSVGVSRLALLCADEQTQVWLGNNICIRRQFNRLLLKYITARSYQIDIIGYYFVARKGTHAPEPESGFLSNIWK